MTETQADEQPNDQVTLPSADTDLAISEYENQVTIDEVNIKNFSIFPDKILILNSFKSLLKKIINIIQDIFDADFDNSDYFGEDEYQNYNDQIDYTQIYDEVTEVKIFYISLGTY